jgi:hypothetical protein
VYITEEQIRAAGLERIPGTNRFRATVPFVSRFDFAQRAYAQLLTASAAGDRWQLVGSLNPAPAGRASFVPPTIRIIPFRWVTQDGCRDTTPVAEAVVNLRMPSAHPWFYCAQELRRASYHDWVRLLCGRLKERDFAEMCG